MVLCEACAPEEGGLALCSECDRCLHLPRSKRSHRRQVVREQQEAVRLECHEGCSRVRMHGLMMIVDRANLKAVVECKEEIAEGMQVFTFLCLKNLYQLTTYE